MRQKPDYDVIERNIFMLNIGNFSSGYVIEIILRFEIINIEFLKNFLVESKFFHFIDRIKISFLICVCSIYAKSDETIKYIFIK